MRTRSIASAGIAALAALAITFTRARSFETALIAVLAYATAMVAIEVWGALKSEDSLLKGTLIRIAASVIVLSALAATSLTGPNDGYLLLTINIAVIAYAFFAIEAFKGFRFGFKTREGKDHLVIAIANLIVLVIYLLDIARVYHLGETPAAGIFAAYTAVLAVLWGLRAFDPKQSG
jgi:hypothetical protein